MEAQEYADYCYKKANQFPILNPKTGVPYWTQRNKYNELMLDYDKYRLLAQEYRRMANEYRLKTSR